MLYAGDYIPEQIIFGKSQLDNTYNYPDMGRHSMKHRQLMCQSFLSVTLLCASASALTQSDNEFIIQPYAEIGLSDFSLNFSGTISFLGITDQVSNDFYFRTTMIKAGLAVSWGDIYANAHYRTTSEDSDVLVLPDSSVIKWSSDRDESGVAVGYKLSPEVAVFVGYRTSETNASGQPTSTLSFKDDGFFLGGSYALNLTESGSLTFSFAHAWLDSDFDESLPVFGLPLQLQASGDGSGAKFGVRWRDFFNSHWGYTLAAERFDFEFDVKGDNNDLDLEESDTTLSLGLFYVF